MATFETMNVFTTMDEVTAALIIQLQIEDSQNLSAVIQGKGKGREGELSDPELALQLYGEDLERNASIVTDRQMTRNIARAWQINGNVLSASLSQGQSAASDRETACTLDGVEVPSSIQPHAFTAEQMDEELLLNLKVPNLMSPVDNSKLENDSTSDSANGETRGESSAWAKATEKKPSKSICHKCDACQEQIQSIHVQPVPCGHQYCRDCLRELCRTSMTDDSLFPPRCCGQPTTTDGVRTFLTHELVQQYEQKKIEFNTPNRTYCSNPCAGPSSTWPISTVKRRLVRNARQ